MSTAYPNFYDLPGAPFASRHLQPFSGQDIRTLIAIQARRRADHPYMVWRPFQGPRQVWTYAQFAQTLERFAAGLAARGIRPGDRVLVHLDNCPEAVIAWFGCAVLGAVAVTTNARSSADELTYFAGHARCVAGITQPRFAALVQQACRDLKWIAVTRTDNGDDAGSATPSLADAFEAIDADPTDLRGLGGQGSLWTRAHDPLAPAHITASME
ncbi:MAG: AMP-binding protein [Burkholderiaceae bacterium]